VITLLTGDNSFELNQALEVLAQDFAGETERIDGSELASDRLIELFSGASLFSSNRMVVIRDLSANKPQWSLLGDQLDRVSDDVHLVLVEPSADKRTATYKRLQKVATVRNFAAWTERDVSKAETWVEVQAAKLGLKLDKKSVQILVRRVGVDQWQLYHALEKLAVLDHVDTAIIESTIEAQSSENVFELLDASLSGNTHKVAKITAGLRQTDDPYRVLALLASQAFQLAALSVAKGTTADVAKDIGAHAFALSRLSSHAHRLGRRGAKRVVDALAQADTDSKSISVDPWLLIERALIKIANQ
jgi:DNA polymerase III delta subunit